MLSDTESGGLQSERCYSTSSLQLLSRAEFEEQEPTYCMLFLPLFTKGGGERAVGVVHLVQQGSDGDFQPICDILNKHLQASVLLAALFGLSYCHAFGLPMM